MKKPNPNQILVGIAVLAIVATGALVLVNASGSGAFSWVRSPFGASTSAIAKKSVEYLNSHVLQQGRVATLISASQESGVIKMKIQIDGKTYDSYASKDGKLIFPEAFAVAATVGTAPVAINNTAKVTPDNVAKVAKTMLDAYVVSGCPYGIQVQRALSDAIKAVPTLAQYVNIRYIGAVSGKTITAMHGVEEADENLRQICIRDEQPAKYWDYVGCYIKKATGTAANGMPYGDSKTCQTETGIDVAKLNACVSDVSRGVADAKKDFDLNAKYNVTGSPTMVLNGQVIDETPFGGRSADAMRNIVCSSSTTAPAFCATKLNTTPATTSFSLTYAGSGATAAAAANCAPAVQ